MSIMPSWPIMPRRILPSINRENCRISHGLNSSRAAYSSVDCGSSKVVRVKMRAPFKWALKVDINKKIFLI